MFKATEGELKRIQKKVKDVLLVEKFPDIADDFRKMEKELAKLKKKVDGLEVTVQKLWAEKLRRIGE